MSDSREEPSGCSTHEALWPTDLFDHGIGWVIIGRFKSGGRRVEAGVFLVDVFCRGVKFACYEACEVGDYQRRIRGYYVAQFPMATTEPCCARKLVEQAVAYAAGLGLPPHPDYKKAARVLGGLRAGDCAQQFTFGLEGKPYYRRGPRETEAEALSIVRHLEQHCGAGNFDYEVLLGEAEDITRFMDA